MHATFFVLRTGYRHHRMYMCAAAASSTRRPLSLPRVASDKEFIRLLCAYYVHSFLYPLTAHAYVPYLYTGASLDPVFRCANYFCYAGDRYTLAFESFIYALLSYRPMCAVYWASMLLLSSLVSFELRKTDTERQANAFRSLLDNLAAIQLSKCELIALAGKCLYCRMYHAQIKNE